MSEVVTEPAARVGPAPLPGDNGGSDDAATRAGTKRFQRHSNATRGTKLTESGVRTEDTRRALIAAYMDLPDTTLPVVPAFRMFTPANPLPA